MNVWLLIILFSMPWRSEHISSVLNMGIVQHNYPCYSGEHILGGWIGADNRIHLCGGPGTRTDRLIIHESQHLLARLYLNAQSAEDWESFGRAAMGALRAGDYSREEVIFSSNMLNSGGQELHAELPWITHGKLPSQLQRWYPWFDLTQAARVKAKHAS